MRRYNRVEKTLKYKYIDKAVLKSVKMVSDKNMSISELFIQGKVPEYGPCLGE